MARLDRLGSAKVVAQDAGLLFRQGVPPHATCLFKHALVQDAAYGTFRSMSRPPQRYEKLDRLKKAGSISEAEFARLRVKLVQ